jgi:hypothetical protein
MEAFEHVVKVHLEAKGYVVTSGVKFPICRTIKKRSGRVERQTHGYEVDLIAARQDSLMLCSVKSFFGSLGVCCEGFVGLAKNPRKPSLARYSLFNDAEVREGIIRGASERYGYSPRQICLALFVGRFRSEHDERAIREHLGTMRAGGGCVQVIGLSELIQTLRDVASRGTYINDPVVVTLKALREAGQLVEQAAEV